MKKRSKFGNIKCIYHGLSFDSKLELQRWLFLIEQQKLGNINALERQEKKSLFVNDKKICDIIPDFTYESEKTGSTIFEDAKGVITPIFRLKAKLFLAIYGFKIKIVTKDNVTTL